MDWNNNLILAGGILAGLLAIIGMGAVLLFPSKLMDNDKPPSLHDDDHFDIYSDKENL